MRADFERVDQSHKELEKVTLIAGNLHRARIKGALLTGALMEPA